MHALGSVNAQTVYRCGDLYKADAQCDSAVAQPMKDSRSTAQVHAQQALTQQTQKEADALEKNRIYAERQASQGATRRPFFPPDNTLTVGPLVAAPETYPPSRGKRHAASPYFTAKDGSESTKTKNKNKNSGGKASASTQP